MIARVLTLAASLTVIAASTAAQGRALPTDSLERARRASALLVAGQADSVIRMMPNATEPVQQAVRRAAQTFTTRAGTERALVEERWVWFRGTRQYWRVIEMTGPVPEPVVIRWSFGEAGDLAGLGVGLLSAAPTADSSLGGSSAARRTLDAVESMPPDLFDSLRARIRDAYVDTGRVESVLAGLDSLRRAGRFDRQGSAAVLAASLTREVTRLMAGDQHFRVLAPEFAARTAVTTTTDATTVRPAAARHDTVRTAAPVTAASARVEQERRMNHFFSRVETLPGNVLLIALDGFAVPTAAAYAQATAAMRRAATADAIIFDLRANGGGAEGLNQFLASHFFAPDPTVVLYERYVHPENRHTAYAVLRDLAAPRSPTTPVYVLVSGATGSAAENFAYSLQQHRRALVIGERTAGAGNTAWTFGLPGGWAVSVPVAHVRHPVSRRGWDVTGVLPDVVVPTQAAVDTALALARRRQTRGPG